MAAGSIREIRTQGGDAQRKAAQDEQSGQEGHGYGHSAEELKAQPHGDELPREADGEHHRDGADAEKRHVSRAGKDTAGGGGVARERLSMAVAGAGQPNRSTRPWAATNLHAT